LFFDVARIIREKRPKGVFLENVKGLVSHDKGKTLATILNALTEIGYHYDWRIINAKNFGVPQNRERIFIVAFDNKETLERFEWPEHSLKTVVFGDIRDDEAPTKYYHTPRYIAGMEAHKLRNLNKGNGFGYHIVEDDTIANTVTVGGTGRDRNWVRGEDKTKNELGLRNMTPREWARLQGYPDSFVFPVSDSQAYKQLGNSVAVPAIQAVAQKMIAAIG
jgi:DNA (cytosine-5)-methyltransferase 1